MVQNIWLSTWQNHWPGLMVQNLWLNRRQNRFPSFSTKFWLITSSKHWPGFGKTSMVKYLTVLKPHDQNKLVQNLLRNIDQPMTKHTAKTLTRHRSKIYGYSVFPKVNWSWMDIQSSKGVRITGPSIKFTGHSHTEQSKCSDSYWSFCPVMNNL
jgi:hypothetical protein